MPVTSASRNVLTVPRMSGRIWQKVDIKVKDIGLLSFLPLCTCSLVPSQVSEASSSHQDTSPEVPHPRETVLTVGINDELFNSSANDIKHLSIANLCCEGVLHFHLFSIFVQTMILPGL